MKLSTTNKNNPMAFLKSFIVLFNFVAGPWNSRSGSKLGVLNLLLMFTLLFSSISTYAQVDNNEGFNGTTFVPTGWTNLNTSGTNTWTRVTTGTNPTTSPQSGAGFAKFNSWTTPSGVRSLITPAINMSARGTAATNVSFWMYRDNGWPSNADKIQVLYNTAASLTGATTLGTVNRSTTLSPTVAANGWYQYTFAVPAAFTGATNYLILKATSAYGNNIYIDNVSWQSFATAVLPCSGNPAPGNTLSTASAPVCSGANFTLSLQNATTGTGVTYQWQHSTDAGATWADVAGATSATLVTSQTVSKSYRCNVTCSGATVASNPVAVATGSCSASLTLTDSYGDGWNGASMNLLVNGSLYATVTIASGPGTGFQSQTLNYCLVPGSTYSLVYTAGGFYPEEVGVSMVVNGVQVYTVGAGGATIGATLVSGSACPPSPTIASVSPLSVCPNGGSITITGTALNVVTGVQIGGTPVQAFVINSATQITASTGAGTDGVVTLSHGTSSTVTGSETVTFLAAPAPPVISTTAVSATFGAPITLSVSSPAAGTSYNWYSTPSAGFASVTDTIYTAPACTNVYVSALAGGCESQRTMVAVSITGYPQIVSSEEMFCGVGGGLSLTAAPLNSNAAILWESLTAGVVLSSTSANPTSATIVSTSDFKLTVSYAGCPDFSTFKSIGVYPLPTAAVTTSATGVCPGTSATINSGLNAGNFAVTPMAIGMLPVPSNAVTLANNGVASIPTTSSVGVTPLDDSGWGSIPLGFTFNYFGSNFSTINVGTNLVLQFGAYNGTGNGGLGDFTYTTFPSLTEPTSIIAAAAHDLQFDAATSPAINGSIKYWTQGYAPNRRFIIQYENARQYGTNGATAKYTTTQIHLFETLGAVDIHVPSSTGTSNKVVGLQDQTRTIGAVALATSAAITNLAWRFAPPSDFATIWTANGNQIASGTNIFTQTVSPTTTTLYDISYTNLTTGCSSEPGSAQVNMVVLLGEPITGVSTTSTVSSVCPGSTVPLSHNYAVISSGLTYQWQSSVDGGITWTDVAGATASTFSPIQNVATSYQVGISACSGPMNYSSPLAIGMSSAQSQSCLTYCIATPMFGTSDGDLISSVSIVGTTLNNNTGFVAGTPSYTLYNTLPNHTATLDPTTNYTVNISIGEYGFQGVAAWIDYNDDGVFSTTERIGATSGMIGSGLTPGQINATGSFTISLACNPPAGLHRLRVRNVYGYNGVNIDPCTNYTWGETEDYFVTINPAPACPTPGVFAAQLNTADMSTAADFIWQQGCATSTSYDFEYGPTGFALGTGTLVSNQTVSVSGTTASYTLTGLQPSSTYDVYARASCGPGLASFWSNAVSVSTTVVAAPVSSPQTFCQEQGATVANLVATGAVGSSINWYSSATSTVYLSTTDVLSSGTYYASQVINGYESSDRAATEITIVVSSSVTTPLSACDSYVWNGATYSESGTYTGTTSNCVTQLLSLTIIPSSTNTSTASACDSYSWNGTTYSASGTYTGTTENCVTQLLSLTITPSSTNTTTASACDSYSWNGTTYSASGTYTGTTENCVTESLSLMITPSSTNTTNASAVGTYTWAENGQTYTSSGVYTGSAVNCLTQALNLTIIPNSATLSLKVLLDGYYINGSNPPSMRAARYFNLVESGSLAPGATTDVDIITVELRSAANLEVVVYSVSPILQTNGNVQCVFPAGAVGSSYYIVVNHRGANPIWSASPVQFSASLAYDFTNNAVNTFSDGDPTITPMHTITSGLYGVWLGELNDDGYLDSQDYSAYASDTYSSGYLGIYMLDGDLNGDAYVDASDYAVFDYNSNQGAYTQRPY